MAIYHLSMSNVSRGDGRSAIASAAYLSGSRLIDTSAMEPSAIGVAAHNAGERLEISGGRVVDYSDKPVAWSEIAAPEGTPAWAYDRQSLWSSVEAGERRKDAQLAKSVIIALPAELSIEQNIDLLRAFVAEHLVSQEGLVCDAAIHNQPDKNGSPQPHAHLLFPTRSLSADGTWSKKLRHLDKKAFLHKTRQAWERCANTHLERAGREERIDHRSNRARGIDLEPSIKVGPAASRREAKGLASARVQANRAIAYRNGERLIANPKIAFKALSASRESVESFVARHSDGEEQRQAVYAAVLRGLDIDRARTLAEDVAHRMNERARLVRTPQPKLPTLDPKTQAAVQKIAADFRAEQREAERKRGAQKVKDAEIAQPARDNSLATAIKALADRMRARARDRGHDRGL
jgi:hypothetical protein